MRVKKIWMALTGVAAAAVLAGCSSGTTTAGVQQAAAESTPVSSSSAAPATTVPATTTTAPVTAPAVSSTTKAPATTTTPKTATLTVAGVPCAITDGACVDISAKKAWLLSGGQIVYGPVPITTGRSGHATPTGLFHVLSKEKIHYSKEFNDAPMPNSVFFYPGDAFHTGSLSTPSHGCVHLSSTSSLKFYNTLRVGDPVQIVP